MLSPLIFPFLKRWIPLDRTFAWLPSVSVFTDLGAFVSPKGLFLCQKVCKIGFGKKKLPKAGRKPTFLTDR